MPAMKRAPGARRREGPFLPGASVDLTPVRRALEAAGYNEEALAKTAGHPLAGYRRAG